MFEYNASGAESPDSLGYIAASFADDNPGSDLLGQSGFDVRASKRSNKTTIVLRLPFTTKERGDACATRLEKALGADTSSFNTAAAELTASLSRVRVTDPDDLDLWLTTAAKQKAAISLIRRGFRVFPTTADDPSLSPADIKKPLKGQSWLDLATTDEARVSELWNKPYNIAIATGGGLLAIDVDVRKDGPKTLRDLERDHGPLPDTATTTTPTGGLHIFMRVPEGVSLRSGVDALGRGVDVKYRGGYVIAPGATIHGRPYVINDLPVADAPEWVLEMLATKPEKAAASKVPACELDTPANVNRATEWLNEYAPEAIEGDGGDRTTYTVAAKLRSDFGLSEGVALDLMVEHWNERCAPPWGVEELAEKVANAYRYGQGAPGGQTAEAEFEPVAVADRRSRTVTSDDAVSAEDEFASGHLEPVDLWAAEDLPPDLPANVVPTFVERFAADRSRRLGVDRGSISMAAIVALTSTISASNAIHMRQKTDSWAMRPIMWGALVGPPGGGKSPALSAASVFPAVVERKWRREYEEASKKYDLATEFAETKKKTNRHPPRAEQLAEVPSTSSPEEGAFTDTDSTPTKPKRRRKVTNDATTEVLVDICRENPSGVLYQTDELSGWLGSMDAYRPRGGKDRPFWLSAKDGQSYSVDRKSGSVFAEVVGVSVLGTIQTDKLRKIAPTLTDDGLLQRFMLVNIQRDGHGEDIPDDPELNASVERVALALADDLDDAEYRLSPESGAELSQIQAFETSERSRSDALPALQTWLDKTPNEFGRLALAFHLIEWASEGMPWDDPPRLVSHDTARRARRFLAEFIYPHVRHVYRIALGGGGNKAHARWVAEYILTRRRCEITAREIGRVYRQLKRPEDRKELIATMKVLDELDWVRPTGFDFDPATKAKVPTRWRVNPAVHDGRFEAVARIERERRSAVRGQIDQAAAARRGGE